MFHEVKFIGRGGQGAVTTAELLASAAFFEGLCATAFPFYGAERRGAPVRAYARISDKPIKRHSAIYHPDSVIVFDLRLADAREMEIEEVDEGLKPDGVVVINARKKPLLNAKRVVLVDASRIASEEGLVVGEFILVGTPLLGAFSKVTQAVSLEALKKAIKEKFAGKKEKFIEKNIQALIKGYESAIEA